jgi:hypothetical protein
VGAQAQLSRSFPACLARGMLAILTEASLGVHPASC